MHDVINCLVIGYSNCRDVSKALMKVDVEYSMTRCFYISYNAECIRVNTYESYSQEVTAGVLNEQNYKALYCNLNAAIGICPFCRIPFCRIPLCRKHGTFCRIFFAKVGIEIRQNGQGSCLHLQKQTFKAIK